MSTPENDKTSYQYFEYNSLTDCPEEIDEKINILTITASTSCEKSWKVIVLIIVSCYTGMSVQILRSFGCYIGFHHYDNAGSTTLIITYITIIKL